MRRTDINRPVRSGLVTATVVRTSPFRVILDGEEYEPVLSYTIAGQVGAIGFGPGSKVIAAWAEDDPDRLYVLDRV